MNTVSDSVDVTAQDAVPTTLSEIPVELIIESPVALRGVNLKSEEFLQLVDSISKKGILNSLTVREVKQQDGSIKYGLIDGLQRFTAAKQAGLKTVPCNVRNMSDADILEAQIIANIHKIETKPAEYTQQLLRILSANPLMTKSELASRLCQSPAWLEQRLSLGKLSKPIQEIVNNGQMGLANAYVLAKLPEEEQAAFVDRAISDQTAVFSPVIKARVKELRDAKAQGRTPGEHVFQPQPHLRKVSDLKDALNNATLANQICVTENVQTAIDGFMAAIKWAMNMDSVSVELQKAKEAERQKAKEAEKAKAKAERDAMAAKKAADLTTV